MTDWLRGLTLAQAWWFFLTLNAGIVAASALGNHLLRRTAGRRRFTGVDQPVTVSDLRLVVSCVLLNTIVSVAGWKLWKLELLPLRESSSLSTLWTLAAFVMLMDLVMYVTHRMAHWPVFYRWFHYRHHQHRDTNPLSLFVLHPFEVLAFGVSLIAVIRVVSPTEEALGGYLFLNILFGSLGHADSGLFPSRWLRSPWMSWLGLGKFHADHHEQESTNFGFYTTFWDRLGRTFASNRDQAGKPGLFPAVRPSSCHEPLPRPLFINGAARSSQKTKADPPTDYGGTNGRDFGGKEINND